MKKRLQLKRIPQRLLHTRLFMNAHDVHVMNLSRTAKEHRAALANQECRGEPYCQEIRHAEQRAKPGTYIVVILFKIKMLLYNIINSLAW